MKTTTEQQKQTLTDFAIELLQKGQDFEIVNEQLSQYVINSQFDRGINVDAIRYLAKCQLGLI